MSWWVWIVVGVLLLAAEVVVTTDFYLAVLGLAALGLAGISASGIVEGFAIQALLYAGLSVLLLVLVRQRLGAWLGPGDRLEGQWVGERVRVHEAIAAGALGRVELHGTLWSARNTGSTPLLAGGEAVVERTDGLELSVRAAPPDEAAH